MRQGKTSLRARASGLALVAVAVFATTLVSGEAAAAAPPIYSDTGCRGDIGLIRVRGSGDVRGTKASMNVSGNEGYTGHQLTLDAVSKAFRARAKAAGVSVNEYDLAYPAVSVGDLFKFKTWNSSVYLSSMAVGRDELKTLLNAKAACTNQRVVVIGYSQGAYVLGDVLAGLSTAAKARIAGAALFADPRFDPADPAAEGSYELTRHGLIGKRQTGNGYGVRVRDYCMSDDLLCQGENLFHGKSFLTIQKNIHARGYPCNSLKTDAACKSYILANGASMARTAGLSLADLLGLGAPPTDVCANIAGQQTAAPPGLVANNNGNCDYGPPVTGDLFGRMFRAEGFLRTTTEISVGCPAPTALAFGLTRTRVWADGTLVYYQDLPVGQYFADLKFQFTFTTRGTHNIVVDCVERADALTPENENTGWHVVAQYSGPFTVYEEPTLQLLGSVSRNQSLAVSDAVGCSYFYQQEARVELRSNANPTYVLQAKSQIFQGGGFWQAFVAVPPDAPVGTYTLTASCHSFNPELITYYDATYMVTVT